MSFYFCQPRATAHRQQPQPHSTDALLSALFNGSASIPRKQTHSFTPNFDVYETESAYNLAGDLPGLADKSAVNIEFTDDRTLLIRGRLERTTKSKATAVEPEKKVVEPEKVVAELEKPRSLSPTVEDAEDEDDAASGFSMVRTPSHGSTASTASRNSAAASNVTKAAGAGVKSKPQEEQKPQQKRWLSERQTYGSFQRSFSFPTPVEVEKVSAALENGVLSIEVPKRTWQGVKKIVVE